MSDISSNNIPTSSTLMTHHEYDISIEQVHIPMAEHVKSSTVTHMSANSLSNSQSSLDGSAIPLDILSDTGSTTKPEKTVKSGAGKKNKSTTLLKKQSLSWFLISLCTLLYLIVIGASIYYCTHAIQTISSQFVYFNEKFENACDFTSDGFDFKHATKNLTLVRTCFSKKILTINASTKESYANMDKLTLFYTSPTTFNIYYFKELSSFNQYNSSWYLDPYSVNYWVTQNTKYGFKQFSLSTLDNSTAVVEEKGEFGIRILMQVNLYSLETLSNSSDYAGWDYLTTISESSLSDYQEGNSTSFPFTISGSFYVESSESEITWLMIGFVLIILACFLLTLTMMMRFQRVFYSGDVTTFLPLFIRKISINLISKKGVKKQNPATTLEPNQTNSNSGIKLKFEKLTFKDFAGNLHLYETSGEFQPYTFTAILGESGSGKTTFINTLSRRARGKMGGKVFFGKKQLKSDSIKRLIGFVPQDDTMIPTLTPRETLLFNSFVRNEHLDMKGHKLVVEKVLRDLKLIKEGYDASNTIIGNEEHRGISGGEKKRVNVGIELVTEPSVLILDEPTTGLDYLTANKTCKILKEISTGGKTVICVIHQPAYETFCLFSDVMVFKTKKVVLKGKREIVCNEIGKMLKMKRGANADEILDFVSSATNEELNELQVKIDTIQDVAAGASADSLDSTPVRTLEISIQPHLNVEQQQPPQEPTIENHSGGDGSTTNIVSRPKLETTKDVSPFYKQFIALLIRSLIQLIRGWMSIIFDAVLSILGGILLGLLFINQSGDLYQGPVGKSIVYSCPTDKIAICALPQKDYVTALASLLIFGCSLTAAMSALRVFGNEKANYIRETLNGINSIMYYLVKDLLSNLQVFIVSFFFSLTFYFIIAPRASFGFYFGSMFLLSYITFPIAYCVSITVSPQLRQITCATIIFLAYMFCGGVPTLTNINEMPQPLPMFPLLSHARYVRELLYVGEIVNYEKDYNIVKSLSLFSYQSDHISYLVLVALSFGIVFRVLAYCLLWQSSPTSTMIMLSSKVKSSLAKIVSPIGKFKDWIGGRIQNKLNSFL